MKRRRLNDVRNSEEGVATTVGTIMALLIFLSLLSLITQQYVPVWMEDNEAYHMDEAKSQFAQMKSNIDNLILNNYKNYPTYSSVKLGSSGVPMFADETMGIMGLESEWAEDETKGMRLSFWHGSNFYNFTANGNITLDVLNRYFEQQSLTYEYGAIILEQDDDSIIRASPPISINEVDDNYSLQISMIDLIGENSRHGGAGTVGITSELLSSSRNLFRNTTTSNQDNITSFSLSFKTTYTEAWKSWLINETDLDNNNVKIDGTTVRIVNLNHISELSLTYSKLEIDIQG